MITIITPTYNRKSLVKKAILSVVAQSQETPFKREMIIVDDGSTDGTEQYIQEYIESHDAITYIYQENAGV
ncbi:glycosyltransferase family 2 protein [Patescibacteria group bacterium]|nr:glycosyltransferase family 2 protein [Patescibacteria group bacterium]